MRPALGKGAREMQVRMYKNEKLSGTINSQEEPPITFQMRELKNSPSF